MGLELPKIDLSKLQASIDKMSKQFRIDPEIIKGSQTFTNTSIFLLSTHGWYISKMMIYQDVYDIFIAIREHNFKVAENILVAYYKSNLDEIERVLTQRYPQRLNVLQDAFSAHKSGLFYSSTILFISQADGVYDGKVFRKKKELIKDIETKQHASMIMAAIGGRTAINIDTRDVSTSNYFSKLNRHGVMHGIHTDYGTEINSYKALSLLNFCSDFSK